MENETSEPAAASTRPRIVIIGAGFGGLTAARELGTDPVQVTVVDRTNHHLFQPLLYQVATAGLSPADIAAPIRSILRHQRSTQVVMAEVTGIDAERRSVLMGERSLPFDYLIIATGAQDSYFGHPEWEKNAPGLKSIPQAIEIRRRILTAFEAAELESDPEKRRVLMTFVLVGAGPTGVEMAGAIAEIAHRALVSDFRHIDPKSARVVLVEAGPRILPTFPEKLSADAHGALERMGVEIRTGAKVEDVYAEGVVIAGERIPARTVIWSAGVQASPAGQWLGAETDRSGRVNVGSDLSVPGHPEIFVIGDTAHYEQDGKPLPGLSPVAMQEARFVVRLIRSRIAGSPAPVFRYVDKGTMATVGRSFAIANVGKLQFSGFLAWLAWLGVHIFYLIDFRNRILVMLQWAWAYLTFQRGARLITGEDPGSEDTLSEADSSRPAPAHHTANEDADATDSPERNRKTGSQT